MSNIMLLLAEEWLIGVSVCIFLSVFIHIVFSVCLIKSCRRNNYDIGVSAFIPIWNLAIWLKNKIIGRKIKSMISNSNIEDEEEFIL